MQRLFALEIISEAAHERINVVCVDGIRHSLQHCWRFMLGWRAQVSCCVRHISKHFGTPVASSSAVTSSGLNRSSITIVDSPKN
ncbi:hypothetical protein [Tychonema sp. LEGE 06208]|uniref:hypothetical protein n=1 Tax=Tychonema sp. LEGE 06208 TaxID=1828663 RepID=UPI001D14F172|nr:hypothetical protein [Tychonema sp. LEGE 06208]